MLTQFTLDSNDKLKTVYAVHQFVPYAKSHLVLSICVSCWKALHIIIQEIEQHMIPSKENYSYTIIHIFIFIYNYT